MTAKEHELYLNRIYSDCYNFEEAIDELIYLTVPSRGDHCSLNTLKNAIRNNTVGALIRRLDPISFNVTIHEHSY